MTTDNPIRAARKERGLSQDALAHTSGVDKNTLVRIELGTRYVKVEHLRAISKALNVPMRELLDDHQAVSALTREDAAEFFGVDPADVKCACEAGQDPVAVVAGWLDQDPADPAVRKYVAEVKEALTHAS